MDHSFSFFFVLQGLGMISNSDTLQFHHKAFNIAQSPVTATPQFSRASTNFNFAGCPSLSLQSLVILESN
jgi:hypothetical protein